MSKNQENAYIFLDIDNNTITAGQDIFCTAQLLVQQDIQNPSFKVFFIGKEWVKIEGDVINSSKVKITNNQSTLALPNINKLEAGSYSFPFIIETQHTLPGTFNATTQDFQGKIEYKMKLKLTQNKEIIAKSKIEIMVDQAFEELTSSTIKNYMHVLICCKFIKKGLCNITSRLNKTNYFPHDLIRLSLEVDNSNAKRTLSSLSIIFWRIVRLINENNEVVLFKKCIHSTNIKANVPSGYKLLTGKEINLDIPIYNKEDNLDLCVSTIGKLIQCRYFIQISTNYGKCISRGIDFEIPITISSKWKGIRFSSTPDDWNPMDMPLMRLSVYPYTSILLESQISQL